MVAQPGHPGIIADAQRVVNSQGSIARSAALLFLLLACRASPVLGNAGFALQWDLLYPDSLSNDRAGCKLCHQLTNGDEPWNAYGWDVRQAYDSGTLTPQAALIAIEHLDSDEDADATGNLDEITAGWQPGWSRGATNTIYYANGDTDLSRNPPLLGFPVDPPDADGFCFPVAVPPLSLVLICL